MDHRMREHNPTYACRQYAYNKAPKRLGESYLVAGGTVAGVATDMLIKQGCRHIVYCGVDMTGHAHADGSTCDGKRSEGDIWGYKRGTLQTMIYRAQDNGIRIESLSPTLLDVPVARELLQQWH